MKDQWILVGRSSSHYTRVVRTDPASAVPFLDWGQLHGLFVLDVASVEAARILVGPDPMIQADVLFVELHIWYGSARSSRSPVSIAASSKRARKKSYH